jgi:hypothetical protein
MASHRPSARGRPPAGGRGVSGGLAPPVWSQAPCNGRDTTRAPSPAARRGRSPRAPLAGDARRRGAAVAGRAAPHDEQRGAEPGGERARTGPARLCAAVERGARPPRRAPQADSLGAAGLAGVVAGKRHGQSAWLTPPHRPAGLFAAVDRGGVHQCRGASGGLLSIGSRP